MLTVIGGRGGATNVPAFGGAFELGLLDAGQETLQRREGLRGVNWNHLTSLVFRHSIET